MVLRGTQKSRRSIRQTPQSLRRQALVTFIRSGQALVSQRTSVSHEVTCSFWLIKRQTLHFILDRHNVVREGKLVWCGMEWFSRDLRTKSTRCSIPQWTGFFSVCKGQLQEYQTQRFCFCHSTWLGLVLPAVWKYETTHTCKQQCVSYQVQPHGHQIHCVQQWHQSLQKSWNSAGRKRDTTGAGCHLLCEHNTKADDVFDCTFSPFKIQVKLSPSLYLFGRKPTCWGLKDHVKWL